MATRINGTTPVDPVRKFRFQVYTVGANWLPQGQVGFSEVSGLNAGMTSEDEYADGNDMVIRKLPGRTKYGDITLKKGCDVGGHLMDWRNATNETLVDAPEFSNVALPDTVFPDGTRNPAFRCNIIVELLDRNSPSIPSGARVLKRWQIEGAWPKELTIDPLQGTDGGILYETAVFSVERIIQVYPPSRLANPPVQ